MKRRRKPRPPEGPLTPREWMLAAYRRTRSRDELRGEKVTTWNSQVHHVLPKSWLRREGRLDLVWDERNSMVLVTEDHMAHEVAMRRIPRSAIRPDTWEFIREIGAPAEAQIERLYPED